MKAINAAHAINSDYYDIWFSRNSITYLESLKLFDRYSNKQAILPWERLSQRFAQGASGNAFVFADTSRPMSVFNRIEYPILRQNQNIKEIIFSPEIRYQNGYKY